jgi:hypothetical protein
MSDLICDGRSAGVLLCASLSFLGPFELGAQRPLMAVELGLLTCVALG